MIRKKAILILAICFTFIIAGCSGGTQSSTDGPSAEVLRLSEDCKDSGQEQCCLEKCSQFCNEQGYEMDKIEQLPENPVNCACWCA